METPNNTPVTATIIDNATVPAKATVPKCPECGGPQRGPKAHAPTCSRYHKTVKVENLAGKTVTELLALRKQIDAMITSKLPELQGLVSEINAINTGLSPANKPPAKATAK